LVALPEILALDSRVHRDVLRFDEFIAPLSDDDIDTYIGILKEPAFKRIGIAVLLSDDANSDFRGSRCGRPIEGDGRNRVSAKSLIDLPVWEKY
jgi:hypothetical protein